MNSKHKIDPISHGIFTDILTGKSLCGVFVLASEQLG